MYHYAGNNPVKYIDPDGREKRIVDVCSKSLDNISPLGKNSSCDRSRSLYNYQFLSIADRENGMHTIIEGLSVMPKIGLFFGILNYAIPKMEENGIIEFLERKAFINGAEKEVERIYDILQNTDNSILMKRNEIGYTYETFLQEQIQILKTEINLNKKYDEKELAHINYNLYQQGMAAYKDNRNENPATTVQQIDYYTNFIKEKKDE